MNIYKVLNEITLYIDSHLEEKIDYKKLAKMMGVNVYTMQRIFSFVAGVTLADYIRKRKLSQAAIDMLKGKYKVMDIAIKYNYENSTSFSRAFEAFHGVKPSKLNCDVKINNYPRIIFNEDIKQTSAIEYEIIELDKFTLYGIGIDVNSNNIKKLAPKHVIKTEKKYFYELGHIKYCMTTYEDLFRYHCNKYYCLYEQNHEDFEKITIAKSKWLKFNIPNREALDIQNMINKFYTEFLPSSNFNLRDLPELEYYEDGKTAFLIAIE